MKKINALKRWLKPSWIIMSKILWGLEVDNKPLNMKGNRKLVTPIIIKYRFDFDFCSSLIVVCFGLICA